MLKSRHLFIFGFSLILSLMVASAFAGPPPAHEFVHFTVYISAETGDPVRYETEKPESGASCLKKLEGMGGRPVQDGLAQVHFCRAVDAKGAPVPEIKVNPETMQPLKPDEVSPQPEAPKVST